MRLLKRSAGGSFVLREFSGDNIPDYVALSHTWAEDNGQEISYQDVELSSQEHDLKHKLGWKKLRFCQQQAETDGIRYLWIDTCCIDKKNGVEVAASINSMFRWYKRARKCYVYLSDVSTRVGEVDEAREAAWKYQFRHSHWWKRGWTLQELIAPTIVEFYSSEGVRLGDKASLERMINDITGIASSALRGHALNAISVEERMLWAKSRKTKLEEDEIYSLLGIFDVSMSLIYGEGRRKAWRRLQKELDDPLKGMSIVGQVPKIETNWPAQIRLWVGSRP